MRNRNYSLKCEQKYLDQQYAIRKICNEFGLTCYKPEYHAIGNDCNTVLIYFNDDHDYNIELDRKKVFNPIYRPYIVTLVNTDVNGHFTLDYMNYGKIDLKSTGLINEIRKYIKSILKI